MDLKFQQSALVQLRDLSQSRRHSVCIEGPAGSGKTYLAAQYAQFLNIPDQGVIEPSVEAVRELVQQAAYLDNNVVFIIENLDLGSAAASNALLKLLEEPKSNVYLVVTCRNLFKIADTIRSRSACVSIAAPRPTDLETFARIMFSNVDHSQYQSLLNCVNRLDQVSEIFKLNSDQIQYIESLSQLNWNDSIGNIQWKISHYADNTPTPSELVISYLMYQCPLSHKKCWLEALDELQRHRLPDHVIIATAVSRYQHLQ